MITQFVEELPEGMTTPDFTRKPIAITIQEGIYDTASDCMLISYIKTYHNVMQFIAISVGKNVVFRAVSVGNPTPEVTWTRNNGEINEERYKITYDKSSGEHQLQVGS